MTSTAAAAVRRALTSTVSRTAIPALGAATLFAVTGCGQEPASTARAPAAANTAAPASVAPTFDFRAWDSYLGGPDSSQFSALTQIDKNNVTQLQVAWTFETGNNPTFNPIMVDGLLYLTGAASTCGAERGTCLLALNPSTGEKVWGVPASIGSRGMNLWTSEDGSEKRLVFTGGNRLWQVDAKTGQPVASFGENGSIDLMAAIPEDSRTLTASTNNPGRIYKDIIVLATRSGANYDASPSDIYAYNLRTGQHLWTFHVIPRAGEFGADTWPAAGLGRFGGGHNWSEMTMDTDLGIVYIPTGTARFDFYGGNRHGANLFTNSVLALDATTGKRIWHFQTVHHDLWDLDLPQAPKLLTVRHEGREVKAIAQASKQGLLYVFDRVTGEPLWPIEERPVPASDVPGEQAWPTQPFPTKPAPFARQSFTAADLNPHLPEADRQRFEEILKTARNEGPYTPPSLQGTIMMPGHNGGANWGSSAVDPQRGRFFVVTKELPTLVTLIDPATRGGGAGRGGGGGGGQRGGAPGGQRGGGGPGGPGAAAPGAAGGGAPAAAGPAPGGARAGGAAAAEGGGGRGAGAPGGRGGPGGGGGGGGGGGRGAAGPPPNAEAPGFVAYTSPVNFMTANGLPAINPPWSQLTAYDLNTGEIMWQVPNGQVTALANAGIEDTGSHAPRGGPVATGSGLLFVGTSSDRKIRAYDADNGKVLWSYDLPAVQEGVPAIYEMNGRQFIVVPVGGTGQFAAQNQPPAGPGQYIAFALPAN